MKTIYPFMGLALCSVTAQAQEKPNFLIIQCDHLTQRVVGAYGQTQGCTLPMDEVASRGVIFSNAYVGCPLSQPSRAALWSGMMPHETNVRSNSSEPINTRIPENIPTLGSLFSDRYKQPIYEYINLFSHRNTFFFQSSFGNNLIVVYIDKQF